MFFIILASGEVLYKAGITQIETVDQAAKALEPLTGELSYLFFAVGVIGTGLLAIPVFASSLAYILAETFELSQGLDKKFFQARGFYITLSASLLIGLSLDFIGLSPIKALLYTAILYGITAPVLSCVITWRGRIEMKSPLRTTAPGASPSAWRAAIFSTSVSPMITQAIPIRRCA